MAFNFKWSPLAADTGFYTRAQELLTTALNKSPKPPIIVDDIIVNELNLGEIPPDLEVLEIGDLDVDRFRGMFKMCYSGNAFLTLKTRVQANPLNTYLSTKPSFTSPQPLAAASGLTIPIQITLSDIKLSAFIILVYSSQKGVTLVFRNDPLESLKVSSTFDAIPFVRDYLQKEIEGQLRTLLMDELPLIIHRLSLRLFNKEYREKEDASDPSTQDSTTENKPIDPLSSPPQDPIDISGSAFDSSQIASLSLEPGSETHALFSQKNLLRLGALTDSHRTLSLFTPGIRDAVFRAWAGPMERGETRASTSGKATPAISRSQSFTGNMSTKYVFSESPTESHHSSRPSLSSFNSTTTLSKHAKAHGGKKRKHRVINLRKKAVNPSASTDDMESVSGDSTTPSATGTTESMSSAPPEFPARPLTPEMKEPPEPGDTEVGLTPPRRREMTPRRPFRRAEEDDVDETPRQSLYLPHPPDPDEKKARRPSLRKSHTLQPQRTDPARRSTREQPLRHLDPSPFIEPSSPSEVRGGAEEAVESVWMNKIAGEILRKVHEQKSGDRRFWEGSGAAEEDGMSERAGMGEPPPAYGL